LKRAFHAVAARRGMSLVKRAIRIVRRQTLRDAVRIDTDAVAITPARIASAEDLGVLRHCLIRPQKRLVTESSDEYD
jgi:hypothetical protein